MSRQYSHAQVIAWDGTKYTIEFWSGAREDLGRHDCLWISPDYYQLACSYLEEEDDPAP